MASSLQIPSVARKIHDHLSRQALGSPLLTTAQSTVAAIYQEITMHQGGKICGVAETALLNEVHLIRDMVHQLDVDTTEPAVLGIMPPVSCDRFNSTGDDAQVTDKMMSQIRQSTNIEMYKVSTEIGRIGSMAETFESTTTATETKEQSISSRQVSYKPTVSSLKSTLSVRILPDSFVIPSRHGVVRDNSAEPLNNLPRPDSYLIDVPMTPDDLLHTTLLRGATMDYLFDTYMDYRVEFGGDPSKGLVANMIQMKSALFHHRLVSCYCFVSFFVC